MNATERAENIVNEIKDHFGNLFDGRLPRRQLVHLLVTEITEVEKEAGLNNQQLKDSYKHWTDIAFKEGFNAAREKAVEIAGVVFKQYDASTMIDDQVGVNASKTIVAHTKDGRDKMKKSVFALLLFFGVKDCYSAAFAQWGIASEHPSKNLSAVKFVEFGKSGEEGKLAYTVGAGGWSDNTGYKAESEIRNGYKTSTHSSLFLESLIGVEPKSEHFYINYKLGPAIITHTDALLGSNVQFAHEIGIGMRDSKEVRVGLVIKHFSNAGIVRPNKGRDFIGVRIEW